MREACLLDRDYAGFYTRQELGFSEEEMVIAIGNVSLEDHLVNTQELRAAQHELRRSTAAAVEAEMEHAINMATLKQDVFGGAQERPAWATSHVDGVDDKAAEDGWSRRSQTALVKCYAAYANEKHLGKESPTVKVTSKLINPKDSKQPHHWAISADWKDKEGFAALMDSDPVFKRQYHLAHREQEWANDWVKKLEKAGIVGEIESPYAAPVIVAPKKDEHGAWTDLRYAVDYLEVDLSSYEGEVGAVVWVVQRFRYYLYGNHFQLITDCKAMEWLRTTARLRGKLARWSLILAEYDFSIKHRPCKDNTVMDLLSRRPMPAEPLRGETTPADVSVEVWQQLVRRCAKYSWHNDKVWLHTGDTASSFNKKHDRLKPMPLFGLFYRFSVDSAGPLPTSSEGHKYVIVIVEHFSKWIELVPVRDLEASTTAKALHQRVLARYGAPVEVVTDNGTEYQGAFREQLERHAIQPVDIPPGHSQANGMVERIVQVLKVALRKVVPTLGTASWHSRMPLIEFGYRVNKQATTGYSPYFLLFGRDHVAPDQVRALLEEPVNMDNDIAVVNLITQRADMLRAAMPKAFERALQAQHRDVVRYRKVRRGDVQPRRHRFEIGSYVCVAQPPVNTLDVRTARTILRVVEILESGWLRLSGSDGNEIQVHMDNCTPCHLSKLVPARYGRGMPACKGCGSDSIAAPRLICDKCQAMWHVACAKAELHPGEEWLCPDCAPPLRR
eukprot:jgi/Tetstr1/428556/TSEL_018550.t1